MSKIYKYFPNDVLELIFKKDGFCGIKCSFPKDYNDPFELFLSVDLTVPTDQLAFYNDVVQKIPQLPTTCFSKAPIVMPMWAHYANNHSGFVLEFDTEKLRELHKDSTLKDVIYQNEPNEKLKIDLAYAVGTKKPRHSYFLSRNAFSAAYFTKFEEWSYEKECRLVVGPDEIENVGGHQILFVPVNLVSAIIVGPNFPVPRIEDSVALAEKNKMNWYQLKIGKSNGTPFMTGVDGTTNIFDSNIISKTKEICRKCEEPIQEKRELCSWCLITDNHKIEAAQTNPFRILDRVGQLEEYIKGADEIGS